MNVLKEGVKRNLCPTVNKETIVITVEDRVCHLIAFFFFSSSSFLHEEEQSRVGK